jgi:HJR/Mrr/RecB family endonuclease
VRTEYAGGELIASQFYRGPNADERVPDAADIWRLRLLTKGFREIAAGVSSRSSSKSERRGMVPVVDVDRSDTLDEPTSSYREDVAAKLQSLPPAGFERFCQRLLRESGFQEVTVTGRSEDGGIDGIGIPQVSTLVSFEVLFQCKRYVGSVSPSQVRDFRGAMARADKGIIITTGSFTSDARMEAVRDGVPPIELVDGEKLIGMSDQLELGLKPRRTYEVDPQLLRAIRKINGGVVEESSTTIRRVMTAHCHADGSSTRRASLMHSRPAIRRTRLATSKAESPD